MADERFERTAHEALPVDGRGVAHALQCLHRGGHFVSRRLKFAHFELKSWYLWRDLSPKTQAEAEMAAF